MERKPVDKWISQGKKNCKSYVFYQDKVLDLSDFILQHPGGLTAIKNYVYKDVTNILFEVYPHQRAPTISKLMKYQVGLIPQNEATNARHKMEKSPNVDRPKQKKKVCFFQQNQKSQPNQNTSGSNEDQIKKSMKKSTVRHKQNMRESTHKSGAVENVSKSNSKGKKKELVTSIRVINTDERRTYEDYVQKNHKKIRQKQRANTEKRKQKRQRPQIGTFSFEINELDEQKPNFKVPILFVKCMNKNG